MMVLSKSDWQERADTHYVRVHTFAQEARKRASRQEKHPVYDFLTRYYPFSFGRFEKWKPGIGVSLENADKDLFPEKLYTHESDENCTLNLAALDQKEAERHAFTLELLKNTAGRPALHSCFGMHEWAMVFTGGNVRHRELAPLRLSQEEIDNFVHSRPLVCTHFDAFRFFSPQAQPLNKHQPTLHDRPKLEQPGCIHVNMDLYKWASKASPWVGSDLQWECFQLALKAREIDMRASPYDLSEWKYEPICIETETGRAEYVRYQKALEDEGAILRNKLIQLLEKLITESGKMSCTP